VPGAASFAPGGDDAASDTNRGAAIAPPGTDRVRAPSGTAAITGGAPVGPLAASAAAARPVPGPDAAEGGGAAADLSDGAVEAGPPVDPATAARHREGAVGSTGGATPEPLKPTAVPIASDAPSGASVGASSGETGPLPATAAPSDGIGRWGEPDAPLAPLVGIDGSEG